MDEILRTLRPGESVTFSHQEKGIRIAADRIAKDRRFAYSLTLGHEECELFRGGDLLALNTARVLDELRRTAEAGVR